LSGQIAVHYGINLAHPMISKSEASAFYRVLGGHDDLSVFAEVDFCRSVTMMIWKSVGLMFNAEGIQLTEETLWIADGRDGMNILANKEFRGYLLVRIAQIDELAAHKFHRINGNSGRNIPELIAAIQNDSVDAGKSRWRLAQRACGKAQAIAETAFGVDYCNFEIACERIVLKTVVAKQQVAVWICREQRTCCGDAVGTDPHRAIRSTGQQNGFVTHFIRGALRNHCLRYSRAATVAATDNPGVEAVETQLIYKCNDQWRLAGAADVDIADDNYWHRKCCRFEYALPVGGTTDCGNDRKKQAKWPEQQPQRAGRSIVTVPLMFQPAHLKSGVKQVEPGVMCQSGGGFYTARITLHALLLACLRRKCNAAVTRDTRRFHDVDYGLMGGRCIGINDDHRVCCAARGTFEFRCESISAAKRHR